MTNEEIRTEYKGYPIIYNEGTNQFEAFVDGNKAFQNGSLRDLREKIDNFEKAQAQKEFKRFKVLINQSTGWQHPDEYTIIEGEVTSITSEGHYWISIGGKRSKEANIIPKTNNNFEKLVEINGIRSEITQLRNKADTIDKSIERLSEGKRPTDECKETQ